MGVECSDLKRCLSFRGMLSRWESYLDEIRLANFYFRFDETWITTEDRPCCHVCRRMFSVLWRSKLQCGICGEIVCRQCVTKFRMCIVEPKRIHVCVTCKARAKHTPLRREDSFSLDTSRQTELMELRIRQTRIRASSSVCTTATTSGSASEH